LAAATDTEVPEASTDAGTDAVSSVAETKVVVAAVPLNEICEVETKLLPIAVISVAGDPTARLAGDTEVSTGGGFFTVKLSAFDGPPPGEGFVTTTGKLPAFARSPVLTEIVSWVALTYVAACAEPLYVTVEEAKKFAPLIVSVCAAAPAVTEVGERVVMAG
jgi:hypothetical protein